MSSLRTNLFVLLCLSLTGCANLYIAPTRGPQAKVRLNVTGSNYFVSIHTFKDQNTCQGDLGVASLGGATFINANPRNNSLANMIGSKNKIDPHIAELVIPAGQPFTLRYNQIGPHDILMIRSCSLFVTFTPEADAQYELVHVFDGKRCGINAAKLSRTPSGEISRSAVADLIYRKPTLLGCE